MTRKKTLKNKDTGFDFANIVAGRKKLWEISDVKQLMRRTPHNPRLFMQSQEMWEMFKLYMQWLEDNPILEEKAFFYQGKVVKDTVKKMRAPTMYGFAAFCGVTANGLLKYKTDYGDDFAEVYEICMQIMNEAKFTGAAADVLNARLIALDMNLAKMEEAEKQVAPPLEINFVVQEPKKAVKVTRGKKK